MNDKMPKWLLIPHTDKQLRNLYNSMPLVNAEKTYEEFKAEWNKQMEENHDETHN